jgi:phospholipid/cholesterol/gamma-HCH transport system substrate-binding protein
MPSVARVRWAKFRVATVAAAAVIIMATLVYLLTGGTLLQQKITVHMYISDSIGLASGSPVRVDGIAVGKVQSVELSGFTDPGRIVKVTMRLERETLVKIPADSFAQLSSETLIGDQFVDITSGTSAETLRPGALLTYREPADMMKTLDIQQFQARLKIVDAMLTDIENGRSRVGQLVQGEQMYRDLRRRIFDIQTGFQNASNSTTAVGQMIHTDTLYRKIREPIAALDQSLATLQSGQGTGGQLLRDSSSWEGMRAGIADLRSSITNVRRQAFLNSDTMYGEWNRALENMMQRVDEFNVSPMMSRADTYESLTGMAREMAVTLKDFRENPKKYLRLKVF